MPCAKLRKPVDPVPLPGERIPWSWAIAIGLIGALIITAGWISFAPLEDLNPVFYLVE